MIIEEEDKVRRLHGHSAQAPFGHPHMLTHSHFESPFPPASWQKGTLCILCLLSLSLRRAVPMQVLYLSKLVRCICQRR